MMLEQKRQLARDTYERLCARLDPRIANIIEHPDKDPKPLPKGKPGHVHLQILPVKAEMWPKGFWGETKCYYEILIGPWERELGSCLGGVQFFRYANQPKPHGSKFTPGVTDVLQKVLSTAPQGFIMDLPNKKHPKFHFQRQYYANYARDFYSYPCETAAKDLAWLISETLPMFQTLRVSI